MKEPSVATCKQPPRRPPLFSLPGALDCPTLRRSGAESSESSKSSGQSGGGSGSQSDGAPDCCLQVGPEALHPCGFFVIESPSSAASSFHCGMVFACCWYLP